jgi:hypothetical protein
VPEILHSADFYCVRSVAMCTMVLTCTAKQTWGLEQDDTTGLAVQRVKRPLVSVTNHMCVLKISVLSFMQHGSCMMYVCHCDASTAALAIATSTVLLLCIVSGVANTQRMCYIPLLTNKL